MFKNIRRRLRLFWRVIRPFFYKHLVWSYTVITLAFCPYLRELLFTYWFLVFRYMPYVYIFLFLYSYFISAPISKNYIIVEEEEFPNPHIRTAIRWGVIRTIKQIVIAVQSFAAYLYTTKLHINVFVVKKLYRRRFLPWFVI